MIHNEGNIHEVMRKEKHIIVTSIDKVYPNIEAAINMIKILSYNATEFTVLLKLSYYCLTTKGVN